MADSHNKMIALYNLLRKVPPSQADKLMEEVLELLDDEHVKQTMRSSIDRPKGTQYLT